MAGWVKIAQSQIGVQEYPIGSNSGKQVEQYLAAVGLGKGYAWCMAFVYWCVRQVFLAKAEKTPLKRTGGVRDQYIYCKKWRVATPQVGDIFIVLFAGGTGHTGFVEKILPNGYVQTIEGNTNANGSREGYAVCRRTRRIKDIAGFIRIDEPV